MNQEKAEELKAKRTEIENSILQLLKDLSCEQAKLILDSTKESLDYHSVVSPKILSNISS